MSKKYNIIYADPPWTYRDKRDKHPRLCGGASAHYKTMSLHDIKALPVSDLAADNCMLFMWATFPNMPEAISVISAWGFKYKTLVSVGLKPIVAPVHRSLELATTQRATAKCAL